MIKKSLTILGILVLSIAADTAVCMESNDCINSAGESPLEQLPAVVLVEIIGFLHPELNKKTTETKESNDLKKDFASLRLVSKTIKKNIDHHNDQITLKTGIDIAAAREEFENKKIQELKVLKLQQEDRKRELRHEEWEERKQVCRECCDGLVECTCGKLRSCISKKCLIYTGIGILGVCVIGGIITGGVLGGLRAASSHTGF